MLLGKHKKTIKKYSFLTTLSIVLSFVLVLCNIFNNSRAALPAELLSSLVETQGKKTKTELFDVKVVPLSSFSWLKTNWWAVRYVSQTLHTNCMYTSYEACTFDYDYLSPLIFENVSVYGMTNTGESFIPLGINVLHGKYDASDFDLSLSFTDSQPIPCLISLSFAKRIIDADVSTLVEQVIIEHESHLRMRIKGIVDDNCLVSKNGFSNEFVISAYTFLSQKIPSEELVLRLKKTNFYTNYSIFMNILSHFANLGSKNQVFKLVFPLSSAATTEAQLIIDQRNNMSFNSTYFFFIFAFAFGATMALFLYKKKIKYKISVFDSVLFIFIYFLAYFLLSIAITGVYYGGIHLLMNSSGCYLNEMCILLSFVFSFVLFHYIFENRKENGFNLEVVEI